jgi:hypothetical protein
MTTYFQNMTTVYNYNDLSILSVQPTSELQLIELDVKVLRHLWDKVLTPDPNEWGPNITMVNALIFELAFAARLYEEVFPDDSSSPATYLQNWMATPLQFMAAGVATANTTITNTLLSRIAPGLFAMPANTTTTARSGRLLQRFVARPWTVWLFISSSAFVVGGVGVGLIWMFLNKRPVLKSAGIEAVDIAARADGTQNDGTSQPLALLAGSLYNRSTWRIGRKARRCRLEFKRDTDPGLLLVHDADNGGMV